MLGSTEQIVQDVTHMHFRFLDHLSNDPIEDVRVVCTRTGSFSACTQKAGRKRGSVLATLTIARSTRKTFFFTHRDGIYISENGRLTLMFVHPNYQRTVKSMDASAVDQAGMRETIVLLRREQSSE